jgi:hypothetical protein
MSLISSGGDPQPSLAWQFEGTTTDYVTGLTGTTTGSVTYGPGKYNQAVSIFNDVTVNTPSNIVSYSTTLNSVNGFTVAVWTRVDVIKTGGSYGGIIGFSASTNTGGFTNYFDIMENSTGTFGFYGQNQAGTGVAAVATNTSTTPTASVWYHIAAVFTSSTISMYVNGSASGSVMTYANAFTTSTMYLARTGQFSSRSYCGSYDDLRIYNTALSATQVQSIWTQGGAPASLFVSTPQPNLAWQFESSNVDYVTGRAPSVTSGTITYNPSGKYGYSANIYNPSVFSNAILYGTTGSALTPDISTVVGFTVCFWFRPHLFYSGGNTSFFGIGGTYETYNTAINVLGTATSRLNLYCQNPINPVYVGQSGNSPVITPGTWNHIAIVCSPGVSYSTITGYVNNTLWGTPFTTNTTALGTFSVSSIGLGRNPFNTTVGTAEFDDLRIYNTALSATQVRSIYNQQGMPGRGALVNVVGSVNTTLTGTPLFSQLSASATSSAVGAFSLRAVNGTSARAVQVRNGTTSATQDFYADRLGNLLTAPVTGTPLATWLAGATGYVTTWYDQSGAGNHATQATAANQPIINMTTSPYSITGGGWVIVPVFSFNFGNGSGYSMRMVVGNTVGGVVAYKGTTALGWTTDYKHWSFGPGGGSSSETAPGLFPYCVGYSENWTYSGTAVTSAQTSVTYVATSTPPTKIYINASQVALNGSYNNNQNLISDPQTAFVIGNGGVNAGPTAPFNGNIYEVLVFSTPLSSSDVTIMG